jgi:hypothetical protein
MYVITDHEFRKISTVENYGSSLTLYDFWGGVFENLKCHNPNYTANCEKDGFIRLKKATYQFFCKFRMAPLKYNF